MLVDIVHRKPDNQILQFLTRLDVAFHIQHIIHLFLEFVVLLDILAGKFLQQGSVLVPEERLGGRRIEQVLHGPHVHAQRLGRHRTEPGVVM